MTPELDLSEPILKDVQIQELRAEIIRSREQLGIAAVALGRIADSPDRTDNHDERLQAQRALLRMREIK